MTIKTLIKHYDENSDITDLPVDTDPILKTIYQHRGITSYNQLNYDLNQLLPVDDLFDIDKAVLYLATALKHHQRIIIIGDFDADGATSTALMVHCLRTFGCQSINYLVPNRFEYGYGLTPEIVDVALEQKPDLIITVDNGISSIDGVNRAKAANVNVIITDHHLPGNTLPNADAIVNPNQRGCQFQSKYLAGVGVAFYVMLALRRYLRDNNWFTSQHLKEPNMATCLDLVALGTIADLVPLDHNNRILVAQGLKRIQHNYARCGINALLTIAKRNITHTIASDLAFAVGPRLNAAGRLDDMSIGIQCLLSDNPLQARQLASQLNQLNQERKTIETTMQTEALAVLAELDLNETDQLPNGICLYHASWHQGVIGIVASRLKEQFHRPTIVFANAGSSTIKGSARSISGLHIRDCLQAIDIKNPGLIDKFGGHAMAAGLSLSIDNFDTFKTAFLNELNRQLDQRQLQRAIMSDGMLSKTDLSLRLAKLLQTQGPWGQHFDEPLFDGLFIVQHYVRLAQKHIKLFLYLDNDKTNTIFTALLFNADKYDIHINNGDTIHLAYRLSVNRYQGAETLQLMIEHIDVKETNINKNDAGSDQATAQTLFD